MLYTKLQPQMPLHVSTQLRIVTPPRFREKTFYVKLTTFSTAQGTKNQIKPIADPKSTLKINMRLCGTVFQILLMSAVIVFKRFCMETRLSNVLKTTNATNVRSLAQDSENTPKIISMRPRITEKLPFKKLKIFPFWRLLFQK